MTRFCITLDQGVEFVAQSFKRMWGGEIFVPKLPSMKITDLAKIMSPSKSYEVIGIRPGEKIHEVMIPFDEARMTTEFKDFFTIRPAIELFSNNEIYFSTKLGEKPSREEIDFEYSSGSNDNFMNKDEITLHL